MESIWKKTAAMARHPMQSGPLYADIAVIGGGMAGVLAAHFLQKSGAKTILFEANTLAGGQTAGTTGKITPQHGLIYERLITNFGQPAAQIYADANRLAVQTFEDIVQENGIECHFERQNAYAYVAPNESKAPLELEYIAAKKLGLPVELLQNAPLPFSCGAALQMGESAQFHPLQFINALAENLTVFEQTRVLRITPGRLVTSGGVVYAKQVVVATHFPFINVPGFYFMRMHQKQAYAIALTNAPLPPGMFLNVGQSGISLRSFGAYTLLIGGGGRTGAVAAGQYAALQKIALQLFPYAGLAARWAAQDCMPGTGLPFIGAYGGMENVYVATGFAKWGMTGAMVAALALKEQIENDTVAFNGIFAPHHLYPYTAALPMFEDFGVTVGSYVKRVTAKPNTTAATLAPGQGGILRWQGKKMGAYHGPNGLLYMVPLACPHLGCQLCWNDDDKTWDCPCHGSRFSYTGACLAGPAVKGLALTTAKAPANRSPVR